MKTAAKVFLILGMVSSSIMALIFGILMATIPTLLAEIFANCGLGFDNITIIVLIVLVVISVTQIIFGTISLSKLDTAERKSQIIPWAILTILFSDILAGIFMLCIEESKFVPIPPDTIRQVE